jgi:hypothetical protein
MAGSHCDGVGSLRVIQAGKQGENKNLANANAAAMAESAAQGQQ